MKKSKNYLTFGLGLLIFAVIVVLFTVGGGKNDSPDPTSLSASVLTAVDNNFDFDTVSMKDGNVSHEFKVKNEGTEPVTINKVYTSCMCTTAYITGSSGKKYGRFGMPGHSDVLPKTNIEVEAGEVIAVEVIFDPAAHGPSGVGLTERSVYLETNSTQSPKLELSFQASVTN